jgi:hypothetical protein
VNGGNWLLITSCDWIWVSVSQSVSQSVIRDQLGRQTGPRIGQLTVSEGWKSWGPHFRAVGVRREQEGARGGGGKYQCEPQGR